MNMKKNWINYICIISGIAMIAVGVYYFTGMKEFFGDKDYLVFGADFYTEIHKATVGVENAIREVHEILRITAAWLFIFGGIADIGYFVKKLNFNESVTKEDKSDKSVNNSAGFICPKCKSSLPYGTTQCTCGQTFIWNADTK